MKRSALFVCVCVSLLSIPMVGCGGDDERPDAALVDGMVAETGGEDMTVAPTGLPLLGNGTHSGDQVKLDVIAGPTDQIKGARDLGFNPQAPDQLWILNHPNSEMVILRNTGTAEQVSSLHRGPGNTHFMAKPAALAFGKPGVMATAPEEDQITQPSTPADFMGPTLWDTTYELFDAGHASHLDMLHNSPNSMGIAWEVDNTYWLFDGTHSSLTRYAFNADHGRGGSDHSDGQVGRYAEGQVKRVAGISSHMIFDHTQNLLFIADTGNQRIAVLDPSTATEGGPVGPNYDLTTQVAMVGADATTFVSGPEIEMYRPSGIALKDGVLYVSDNNAVRIYGFDSTTGELLDFVDLTATLQAGALSGMDFGPDGHLYFTDSVGSQVYRLSPL